MMQRNRLFASTHWIQWFLLVLTLWTAAAQAASVEDFRQSWAFKALGYQRLLDLGEPLGRTSFQYTHNSYNSKAYANLGSYFDPNHTLSLVDQLDSGIRAIELDVHYTYGTSGKDLLLCHGTNDHIGCSIFDRRFEDGIKEVATWVRQSVNRQEVLLIYIEEHTDAQYDRLVDVLDAHMGDLIYKPGTCRTLPMSASRADILNAGKQVIIMGGNCGNGRWAATAFNYEFPTGNDTFEPYPACRTQNQSQAFMQSNLVRLYEDTTSLSATFGTPPQAITPALMAQAMQCNLGIVGLDKLVPFDARLEQAVWSWNAGEPNNYNGAEHCAEQWSNGRFNDNACGQARPFACQNASTREWRITPIAADWTQGAVQCAQAFGSGFRFAVPKNGFDNQQLKNAKDALSIASVWMNYSDLAKEGEWLSGDHPVITGPAPTNPVVWRKLRNDKGKCLDLEGRNTANGTEIHQWSCHGADSQLWWQDDLGMIHNKMAPNKCVDVAGAGTSNGSRIHLWDCHGGDNQLWLRGASNSFRISNALNKAMDIKDPFWGDGQRAHLWDYHGGKSQRWSWD